MNINKKGEKEKVRGKNRYGIPVINSFGTGLRDPVVTLNNVKSSILMTIQVVINFASWSRT